MKNSKEALDNLKILGNIREKRQRFIREKLNVRTYQDLANLSVEHIVNTFQTEGKLISQKTVQQWIDRAGKLAQEDGFENDAVTWEWLNKVFVVEFRVAKRDGQIINRQSRIYHVKVNENGDWLDNGEKTPAPKKGNELYNWMLHQLGEESQLWEHVENSDKVEATAQALTDVQSKEKSLEEGWRLTKRLENIKIDEIRIFDQQHPNSKITVIQKDKPVKRIMGSSQPYQFEVAFKLPEMVDMVVDPNLSYNVDFYIKKSGKYVFSKDSGSMALKVGKALYTARFSNVLLQRGLYSLGTIVYIQSHPPSANFFETPRLEVF